MVMVSEIALNVSSASQPLHIEAQGTGIAVSGKSVSESDVISSVDMQEAVHKMQDYMQSIDRDLHFSVDKESGLTVIKVIDPSSGDVVRQIPSEEVLKVVRSLEHGGGLLSGIEA